MIDLNTVTRTPSGLSDEDYLARYRGALALVDEGKAARIEHVLTDWAPCHIGRFHELHLRAVTPEQE